MLRGQRPGADEGEPLAHVLREHHRARDPQGDPEHRDRHLVPDPAIERPQGLRIEGGLVGRGRHPPRHEVEHADGGPAVRRRRELVDGERDLSSVDDRRAAPLDPRRDRGTRWQRFDEVDAALPRRRVGDEVG
jgi:hypothetical protein